MKETYEELLARAPKDHISRDFQLFLMNNNKVRFINHRWLVIENCKYRNEENDWLTAFYIRAWDMEDNEDHKAIKELGQLLLEFPDREVLIKAPSKRSVKLFHVHLYKV